MSTQWELQKAVYGVLTPAIAPVLVYDSVPQEPAYPYAHIGETYGGEWDTDDSIGREIFFTVHTWSRYDGARQLHELMDTIKQALHNVQFAVPGEIMVLCLLDYMNTSLDPDGLTRHGVQRFMILLESNAGVATLPNGFSSGFSLGFGV